MKKTSLILSLLIFSFQSFAQLTQYSQYLIDYYNVDFELTIKRHAFEEYPNNQLMLETEINDQAESLFNIVEKYNFENKEVFLKAISNWSYDGYEEKNLDIFRKTNKVSIEHLLKLHCNWVNVLYDMEYKKKKRSRVKGKNKM